MVPTITDGGTVTGGGGIAGESAVDHGQIRLAEDRSPCFSGRIAERRCCRSPWQMRLQRHRSAPPCVPRLPLKVEFDTVKDTRTGIEEDAPRPPTG